MSALQTSMRGMAELISHEGAVLEAYKDSKGVWTWGIGVTNASGHRVFPRYLDNPQSLQRVLEIFVWLVREKYEPAVVKAFHPIKLSEHQLAAAVSFHYNTGGIERASWVREFKAGRIASAKRSFMNWSKPKEIIPRRRAERDLFFDAKWTDPKKMTVYPVTPRKTPDWSRARRVDIREPLALAMGVQDQPAPEDPQQNRPQPDLHCIAGDAAAADRVSTTEIASIGAGLTGAAATVGEVVRTVQDTSASIMDAGPWVLVGVLVIAFAAYIWRERRRKKMMAREALGMG